MDTLTLLWTNDNKDVFLKMVSMYALNSKKEGWWKNVNLIIWGPSAKLASEDTQIQTELVELLHVGVHVEACKACSDSYEVSDKLERLGITVRYMGESLTEYLKNEDKILTF